MGFFRGFKGGPGFPALLNMGLQSGGAMAPAAFGQGLPLAYGGGIPAPRGAPMEPGRAPVLTGDVADARKPEGRRRRGFLHRLGDRLDGEQDGHVNTGGLIRNVLTSLQMGQLDPADRFRVQIAMQQQADRRREAREEAAQRESLHNNLMKDPSLGGLGLNAGAAERAMVDPSNYIQEYNTRFRTREASPGTGIVTPDMAGGAPNVFRMPTQHEQIAAQMGLQPGTPEWNSFIERAELDAQSSEAMALTRRGQDITERNNIRSTGVSRENSIRSEGGADRRHNTPPNRPGQGEPHSLDALYTDILRRAQSGQRITPQERDWARAYGRERGAARRARGNRPGGRSGSGGGGNGAIIRNPQTGQRMQLQGGRWVPVG